MTIEISIVWSVKIIPVKKGTSNFTVNSMNYIMILLFVMKR